MQPLKTLYFLVALCCYSVFIFAKNEKLPHNFRQQSSLLFIENKGQITDQHGAVRNDIDFKLQTPELTMFIGNGEIHYQWVKATEKEKIKNEKEEFLIPSGKDKTKNSSGVSIYRMDVNLVGANTHAYLLPEEPDEYYENHYSPATGQKGATAHSYKKLTYRNIYPNIDWVLYVSKCNVLKYDFIVHPGGKPDDIKLRYDGVTDLNLHDGALTATTPYGSITEEAPYTYNAATKQQVASSFVLNGNTLSFNVEKHEGTLVIDPQLHWATYYGDGGISQSNSVCVDDSGFVYMISHTSDKLNIATSGTYQSVLTLFHSTGYLVKFDKGGNRIWGTYYGGNLINEYCYFESITSGNSGEVYVGGYGYGASLTTGSTHQIYNRGGLMIKFSSSGQRVWASFNGDDISTRITDLVMSDENYIYAVGTTDSDSGIATANTHKPLFTSKTTTHAFLLKFDTSGVKKWGTYFGDTLKTEGQGLVCDHNGGIIIAGRTYDTRNIATPGAHKVSMLLGDIDGFIAHFDSTGNLVWSTYCGGAKGEYIEGIANDDNGNIYICGRSTSDTGIATRLYCQPVINTSTSFVVKFNSFGQRQWGSYLPFRCMALDVSSAGFMILGGDATNRNLATVGSHQKIMNGESDAIIAKLDLHGNLLWATYVGGDENDIVLNIALADTIIYMCGLTLSTQGLVKGNAHQANTRGFYNTDFLARMDDGLLDTVMYIERISKRRVCVGDTIQVNFDFTPFVFTLNNKFKVELSNSSGSFTSPIEIGKADVKTMSCNTRDSIKVVIPADIPTGNYKIRLVSSEHNVISADSTIEIFRYPFKPVISGNIIVCSEDTLNLNAPEEGADVTYKWSGPSSFISTGRSFAIANFDVGKAGRYIVVATRGVCSASDTTNVGIKPLPARPLASNNGPLCEKDTLKLNSSSTTTGITYVWTGPANFISGIKDTIIANVAILTAGKYVVAAILDGCVRTDTTEVVVKPIPAGISAEGNTPICQGANMQFNATTTTNGVTWNWTGPNSFTTSLQNPFILSAQPMHSGDYVVTATLNGCHAKDTVAAVINVIPVKPTITANTPVCENDSLRFSGTTTTAGVAYSWSGPQSFAGGAGDTIFKAATVNASGQYTLTVSKDGCSNAENVTVTVKPLPASVTVSSNTPICEGNTLQLGSSSSTTGSTYSWSGPNTFVSSIQSPAIPATLPAATGWYYITVELNGCSIKDSTQATVNPIPVLSNTTANQPLCLGQTLNLATANINNAAYSWTGPNSYTITGRTPSRANMQYTDTGWYRIVATANNCLSKADSVYVKLNPIPFVVIFAGKDSICKGDAITFNAIPNQHGATPTYVWKINGTPAGVGSSFSTPTLNNGDIISCDMTEYTKCSGQYVDASNDITMTVMPWLAPSVSILANPSTPVKAGQQVQFSATPVNGGNLPTYQWKRNGNNIHGATGITWSASTLNDNDEICLEMMSNYMCPQPASAKSNCIKVRVLTGIGDEQLKGNLTLYPNPNNGRFILSGRFEKAVNGAVKAEVLNTLGQVIYRGELQLKSGELYAELQLPQVAGGTYLLRMSSAEVNHTMRFDVR